MPLRLTLIRQASKKLVAKLKPKWLGKGMRSISRGISRIPLNPVVAAVQAIGNVGSSVPFLQGVSSIVATILQRTETVKQNRKECKELASLAMSVGSAVRGIIEDVPEDELDEKMKKLIAELEKCTLFTASLFTALITVHIVAFCKDMNEIVKIMTRLKDKPVWRRFLRKDKHSDALAEHKQRLKHGLNMFLVKEVVASRHAQCRGRVSSMLGLYTDVESRQAPQDITAPERL